jgi:hypothetical protein
MKKIYTILLSAAMLATAAEAEARVGRVAVGQDAIKSSKTELTQAAKAQRTSTRLKAQKRADAEETTADQPITEPVGTAKNYTVASASYTTFWGYTFTYEDAGMVGEVVFDEATSSAYIKNPIAMLLAGTYIKGTYTDTQISVQLPQTLFIEQDGSIYYAHRMVKDEEASEDYAPVYNVDDSVPFTYSIAADGTITGDNDDDTIIIGLTDEDGEWAGYGDYAITMTPFDKTVLSISDMPEDFSAKLENWIAKGDGSSKQVQVAEYNGKIYIAGLSDINPEALAVGDIDGTTVTFESEQFLGIDTDYNYYQLFYGLKQETYYDDWYEEDVEGLFPIESAQFTYDAAEGLLTCTGDGFGVIGGDLSSVDYYTNYVSFTNATIKRIPDDISLVPAAPYNLDLEVDGDTALLSFALDALDVDGWPLDENNLYYRIYFNDEIFTLSPDVYYSLEEDKTDIGFYEIIEDADGYYDVYPGDSSYSRYFYFYFEAENPGIQAVYKDGDTEYTSPIVYYADSSIKETFTNKPIVAERYTDLSGRAANRPVSGFYLKTVTYCDGTQATVKTILK